MKKEFVVERHGRTFVLYAGLLNMAHESGLTAIETQLIQAPTDQNGGVAICSAAVTLTTSSGNKRFTGIGDASASSVSPAMQTSLIRMAETRAKARALRDAVNVGMASVEEEGMEDAPFNGNQNSRFQGQEGQRARRADTQLATAPSVRSVARPPAQPEMPGSEISSEQIRAIQSLATRKGVSPEKIAHVKFGKSALNELNALEAGELIRDLSARGTTAPTADVVATDREPAGMGGTR